MSLKDEIKNYRLKIDKLVLKLSDLVLYQLDRDVNALNEAFIMAYNDEVFNLHQYESSLQNALKLELFCALTPLSGSLSFLAIQILAANRIMQSHHFTQADKYYRKKCGIIINHLRAPITVIDSIKSEQGYKLTGKLTWASGYGIFDNVVVGFHHEGRELQAVMPFKPQEGCLIGDVDDTFVGVGMNTVSIDLNHYEVRSKDVISCVEIGNYTKQKAVSKTIHFALYGIGLGAIRAISDEDVKSEAQKRLEKLKEAFMSANDGQRMDELRIELFECVLKTITTGMVLYGGKSMLSTQRLQQYYRELIMFNSNGLNGTVKELFKASYLAG